jgi:hypothetical protein
MTTSIPLSSARRDRVPMMSSASAPGTSILRTPRASTTSFTTGTWARSSSGTLRRFALYSGKSSCRGVVPGESKTAAIAKGFSSRRIFRRILAVPSTTLVGVPSGAESRGRPKNVR